MTAISLDIVGEGVCAGVEATADIWGNHTCEFFYRVLVLRQYYDVVCLIECTGCNNTLFPPPQPKLKKAQYNQTYCRKVESISAMDFQYLGRSLMIGWRNKSWNPERVPSVVTLSVCMCAAYRSNLLAWEPNFWVEWSSGNEKKKTFLRFYRHFSIFILI